MIKTYRFDVEVEGDIFSGEAYPIYDDRYNGLIGGFYLVKGNYITGFVSGSGHPAGIAVSLGDNFYFTPKEDLNGKISHGLISEHPISALSVPTVAVEDEMSHDANA